MKHTPNEKEARSYSVKEVATAYFPHVTPAHASKCLRKEIEGFPKLRTALEEYGWSGKRRSFTPKQVEVLTLYLGEV